MPLNEFDINVAIDLLTMYFQFGGWRYTLFVFLLHAKI